MVSPLLRKYCIADLKEVTPVPGPTKIKGRSAGNVIVPFFSHTGTISPGCKALNHREQTPTICLLKSVSYSVIATVKSTVYEPGAEEMLNSLGLWRPAP